jgi:hypothetical protein
LPQEIVTAWRDAGAEVGWLRAEEWPIYHVFSQIHGYYRFVPEKHYKQGDLPVFRFRVWQPGALAKLPIPTSKFGLFLGSSKVTDEGLKELTQFDSLQFLDLSYTLVTDVGLEKLAQLPGLQTLDLGTTQVKGETLDAFAKDPSLHMLVLSDTPMAVAGLQVLAKLKNLQLLDLSTRR